MNKNSLSIFIGVSLLLSGCSIPPIASSIRLADKNITDTAILEGSRNVMYLLFAGDTTWMYPIAVDGVIIDTKDERLVNYQTEIEIEAGYHTILVIIRRSMFILSGSGNDCSIGSINAYLKAGKKYSIISNMAQITFSNHIPFSIVAKKNDEPISSSYTFLIKCENLKSYITEYINNYNE